MNTPWGKSDHQKKYADGIVFYGTPSHGGFKLSAKRNAKVPEYMRRADGWYEEDCEWSIVAIVFPEYFANYIDIGGEKMPENEYAQSIFRNWFPDEYEKFFDEQIKPGESYKRDEKLFREAHKNDWIVVAAVGDWHDKVPQGFVGCSARLGGRDNSGQFRGEEKNFLVPETEYHTRNQFGFVIDLERHPEVGNIF